MRRLLASMFIIALAMGMAGLALPLYANDLGASYTEIGMLGVAYVIFDVFFSVPVGRVADRQGRKPLLLVGFFTTALVIALYSFAGAVFWLIILRFIQGAAEAPIWVNAQSAVADLSPRKERGRAMGAYGASWAAGIAIGPLIGGILYKAVGAAHTFLLSALVALTAAVTITSMPLKKPCVKLRKVRLRGILPACLISMVYVGVVSTIFILFPVYASKLGMNEVQIGLLITLFAGIRAVLFIPLGGLSDRFGHRPIILAGILGLLTSAGLALTTGYLEIAILISLLAAAEGAIYPAVMSMVSKVGEGQNLGYVLGIFNAVAMIGWALFPGLGGVLADAYGPTSPYLMCAVIALVSFALVWKLLPKK